MKHLLLIILLVFSATYSVAAQSETTPDFWGQVKASIQRYMGRPYVWGASGLKSFDCSGFVWRVMAESGVLMKRTTARKFYMILPKAEKADQSTFGTLIFFDDLTHIGIVDDPDGFYHSEIKIGTHRSRMSPFYKKMIYGYRKFPVPEGKQ